MVCQKPSVLPRKKLSFLVLKVYEKPSVLDFRVYQKPSVLKMCYGMKNRPFWFVGYVKNLPFYLYEKPSFLHSKPCIYAKICIFQFITFTWFHTHFGMVSYSLWNGFVIQTFAFFGKIFVVVCRICCF